MARWSRWWPTITTECSRQQRTNHTKHSETENGPLYFDCAKERARLEIRQTNKWFEDWEKFLGSSAHSRRNRYGKRNMKTLKDLKQRNQQPERKCCADVQQCCSFTWQCCADCWQQPEPKLQKAKTTQMKSDWAAILHTPSLESCQGVHKIWAWKDQGFNRRFEKYALKTGNSPKIASRTKSTNL